MAPSDATGKNRNIGAQLQSIPYTTAEKDFGKFTYCRSFGAHKLVHCEPFWGYLCEFRHLLLALGSVVRNFFLYRCTSTVQALNYCSSLFFKSLSYLYEVVRTTFSANFFDFRNFLRFGKFPSQICESCGATYRWNYETFSAL